MQDNINAPQPPSPLTCQRVTDAIITYLNGEMAPETRAAFERHLQRCTDCDAFFKTYNGTLETTRSLTYESIPNELSNRVLQFLQKTINQPPASGS